MSYGSQSGGGGNSAAFWSLFHLAVFVVAVLLAWRCNCRGRRFLPVLGAAVFPEIYLIQRGVRSYVLHEPGYGCDAGRVRARCYT